MRSSQPDAPLRAMTIQDVPAAVDLNDLQDGFFLLTAAERVQLIAFLDKHWGVHASARVSKKVLRQNGLPCKYSVVIADGKYQIMYLGRKHNKHAGVGAFGVVKYFQDLKTGQFDDVVKIYSERHVTSHGDIRHSDKYELNSMEAGERKKLFQAGMATNDTPIVRTSGKKGMQIMKPQQAAKGVELGVFIKNYVMANGYQMTEPAFLLQIFINFALAVKKLNEEKGIIHRDIKPENVMVDPGTWEVTIIDFGLSVPVKEAAKANDRVGTPMAVPPEVIFSLYYPEYGEKTEAFGFGATLAEVLGMLDQDSGGYVKDSYGSFDFIPSKLIKKDHTIRNDVILSRLYDLCEKLLKENAGDRINVTAALQELIAIQQLCVEPMRLVGINVAEIADSRDAAELFEYLNLVKAQEIVLLFDEHDLQRQSIFKSALEFTREARLKGFIVHSEALVIPENSKAKDLQAVVSAHFDKKNPAIKRDCMISTFISGNQQKYFDGLCLVLTSLPESTQRGKYLNILADDMTNGVSPLKTVEKLKLLAVEQSLPAGERNRFMAKVSKKEGHELQDVNQALMRMDLHHPYEDSSLSRLYEVIVDKRHRESTPKKFK